MITRNESKTSLVLTFSIVYILLAAISLPSVTQAAPSVLPPRPTPQSTPRPKSARWIDGGFIELRFQTMQQRVWSVAHWQELWSVVRWQDGQGDWHNVKGWQGTFDEFYHSTDTGLCEGKKLWWVAEADFGKGPFQWLVYQGRGDKLLAQSESFYLPQFDGEIVRIEISLVP